MKKTSRPQVSLIILNHNAGEYLGQTLNSIKTQQGITYEVIIVDNLSSDNPRPLAESLMPEVVWLQRATTTGFSAGNNLGVKRAKADTILFLNPDITFLTPHDLKTCYDKLWSDPTLGVLTARVKLALTGAIDDTSHRGFPTPWAAFTHFSGLSRLIPVPLFNRYTKRYLGYTKEHQIDAVGGMFMLLRREVGEQVGWWDESFPLYGEDLDFCYRVDQAGYRNWYYPRVTVLHYKGITTGMSKQSRAVTTAKRETTRRVKLWSVQAMEIFYRKHYWSQNPFLLNWLVLLGIKLMYLKRVTLS